MARHERETDAFGRPLEDSAVELIGLETDQTVRRSFYEEFFSGYSVRKIIRKTGQGTKIVREYNGILYQQQLGPEEAVRLRVLYAVLFTAASALWLVALLLNTQSNRSWYVMLVAFLSAVGLARVLLPLHTYVWSSYKLKEYEYRFGARLLPGRCTQALFFLLALALTTVIMLILEKNVFHMVELLRFMMLAGSAAVLALIRRREKRIRYTRILPSRS